MSKQPSAFCPHCGFDTVWNVNEKIAKCKSCSCVISTESWSKLRPKEDIGEWEYEVGLAHKKWRERGESP